MNGKEEYLQIPIPEDLQQIYQQSRQRWERRHTLRLRRMAAMVACAAFLAGMSVPVLVRLHRQNTAGAPAAAGSAAVSAPAPAGSAASSEPLDTQSAAGHETTYDFLPTYQGDGIRTLPAETRPNEALRALLVSHYDVPEDYRASTRYFYNYADLNGDGTEEIFVDVCGPYTSGTGGDSALILSQSGGKLQILQSLTLVNIPVIVSDTVTDGWHDLIFPYTGGGAVSSYVTSRSSGGRYASVGDAQPLASLQGVTGTSILYTDPTAPDAPQLTLEG